MKVRPAPQRKGESIMKKLRLGIIGTGGICNNKHLPSLAKVADKVEVVALCDLEEEKARATAERHGLKDAAIYTDYKELLKDPTIDVVHVCTPNVAHCQITVDAFEAGKHVLCEKPMAATTLCGTLEGAEIKYGGSYPEAELWFNHTRHGKMMQEQLSGEALVDYFEGVNEPAGVVEARQWIDAILNDTEPCVKPEEAFRITQILDSIYKASETNTTIKF